MNRWKLILIRPDGSEVESRTTYLTRRVAQANGRRATRKPGWRFKTERVCRICRASTSLDSGLCEPCERIFNAR
jgi:hypothetical protein